MKTFKHRETGEATLTTEDGVKIFEKDELYFVYNNFEKTKYHNVIDEPFKVKKFKWAYDGCVPTDMRCYHWFSTKEAAEEYVLLNKPTELSIKEITPLIGRCNETTYVDLDCLTEKLKQLVKSKL